MSLLKVVVDVRLQIYSELLTQPDPITFWASCPSSSSSLVRSEREGLHPAILRVCRLILDEALPILYSHNRFCFPEIPSSARHAPDYAHVIPFFRQIGTHASLIRHICMPFPAFAWPMADSVGVHDVHVEVLELIKTNTNIKSLELSVSSEHFLLSMPNALVALGALDEHFKTFCSLQEILIVVEEYPDCEPSDDLLVKIRKMGWAVKVERLPERVWISCDDRVKFDNEDDCREYDDEWFREEQIRQDAEEEREWCEEYHRRRMDPYWRNDSDYD